MSGKEIYASIQELRTKWPPMLVAEALHKLVESEPTFSQAYVDLAVLQYAEGDTNSAGANLERALNNAASDGSVLCQVANAYFQLLGNEEAAINAYMRVIQLDPKDIEAYLALGEMCIRSEKLETGRNFKNSRYFFERVLLIAGENQHAEQRLQQIDRFAADGYAVRSVAEAEDSVFPDFLYPQVLSIFLTTRCNLRCFICRRETHTGTDLVFDNLHKLENAIHHASHIDLTGWGECFLYPHFEKVLETIYRLNSKNDLIQITTNGTLLSRSKAELLSGHLKYVIISLNAATAATYNRDMQYGNFEKTIASIRDFMTGLHNCERSKVSFHFVAHTENFREIPDFVLLARDLGISRISIGNYLIGNADHSQYSLLKVKDEYNQVISSAEELGKNLGVNVGARHFYSDTPAPTQTCTSPLLECFISPDGLIGGPCCFSGSYEMGNVYETSFESVWFSDKYERLRRNRHLPACQRCTPFTPFDDLNAHFTGAFKSDPEFKELMEAGGRKEPVHV